MQDQIVSLKFSPDWTPTRSIVQEDYLNQAQADPAYFDQKGWQVYLDGERTTSASIDWTAVDLDKVTVRQPSGASNALGGVRFSLTNNRAIYLHDTNAHSLFDEPKRLFSSGCVRVEDASWLAHWIMGGQPVAMSMEQVKANMALGTQDQAPQPRLTGVYFYLTVWVDGANRLHWEEDVYGHDKRLRENAVSASWALIKGEVVSDARSDRKQMTVHGGAQRQRTLCPSVLRGWWPVAGGHLRVRGQPGLVDQRPDAGRTLEEQRATEPVEPRPPRSDRTWEEEVALFLTTRA